MKTLTAVIVEDDPGHVSSLKNALTKISTQVQVVAECTNVTDAFQKINEHNPELVFLDIELDLGENGFDLLKKFSKPKFSVIFTTQHSTNTNLLNALRASALDFLAKAVKVDELNDAIIKYNKDDGPQQLETLWENTESAEPWMKVLLIKNTEGLHRIDIDNISHASSDGPCTTFHVIKPAQKITKAMGIGEYAEMLVRSEMIRCHREWMVNLRYCKQFNKRGKGGYFTLENGLQIPVSEGYRHPAENSYKNYKR